MEFKCNSIREYLRSINLKLELPNIKLCLFDGVYKPKLDSFLIAKELVKIIKRNEKVLDIGTGTGILAILSAKKGAFVVATDIDRTSVKCAEYNAFLNNIELDMRVGSLFEPVKEGELFDVIVSNMTSLPTPPDEQYDENLRRNVDAGTNGRKYLDPLISKMPKYLKDGGYFLTLHSNFSDIEKTKNKLENLGFKVELKIYECSIGKTSGQRIDYFLKYLPKNCHPIKKNGWYQKIGIFKASKG